MFALLQSIAALVSGAEVGDGGVVGVGEMSEGGIGVGYLVVRQLVHAGEVAEVEVGG
jgi:hypothetical protein